MRIRELRLAGFKSFVDPTRLPIEPGLTGVVGPNGCGKSNLLEAVRWVMGAASAKALRADDMDAVIFAGSGTRPARETADVAIVLEDAAGKFPGDPGAETLEVTRRIRREAGSTYKINGRDARAKDVQLLFADASTGANSPALVRQGQISELISAKPENRRRILEEAAGVAGLHARRHEADLKLRAAEANLLRVDDALKDMESQTATLRRQARQAERYREIAEELRRTEALLAARVWRDAGDALEASRAELRAAEREVADAAEAASIAARRAMEAEARLAPAQEEAMIAAAVMRGLEGKRIGLERDAAEIAAAAERRARDTARSDEDAARAARDAEDAAAALARLDAERAALGADADDAQDFAAAEARAAAADAARAAADAEADRLEAETRAAIDAAARAAAAHRAAQERFDRANLRLAAAERDRAALQGDADLVARRAAAVANAQALAATARAAAARVTETETALAAADAAERKARETRDAAQAALRKLDAEVEGVAAATVTAGPKIKAPALDAVRAAPGYEKAVAAALGDDAMASLDAREAAAWRGATAAAPAPPEGAAPLAPHVEAPPELAARLALCFVAPAAQADAVRAVLAPGMRLVTLEGDLHRWDGLVRRAGAAQMAAATRLEQRNRLTALKAKAAAARDAADESDAQWRSANAARAVAADAVKAARAAAPSAQAVAAAAEKTAAALDVEIARHEARRAALDAQHEAQARDCAEARAALEAAPALSGPQIDEDALAGARVAAQTARGAAAEARAAVVAIVRSRTLRAERRTAIARERADWERRSQDASSRTAAATAAKRALDAEAKAAAEAPAQVAAAQARLADDMQLAERRASAAADSLAQTQSRARDAASDARAAAHRHAAAEAARIATASATDAAVEVLRACEARAEGRSYQAVLADAGELVSGPLARAPALEVEKRIERLRGERDAAGAVNLRAADELEEALARAEGLVREKEDVVAAINKLRFAIGRLNGEARTRLRAAFEAVSAHFAALFATLFEGGEATLKLTESDDPLAAGLEIYASPPGKKLTTLSLMSGGEQALTATALIFAVFLANPAPLCVLDEVDAPLDDANVDRFCRMLAEMRKRTDTRFLVITHNPVTMARMDRLYGVTMAEAGVSQIVSVDLQKATALAA